MPEDIAYESLCEVLTSLDLGLSDEKLEKLADWVSEKLEGINRIGYAEGVQETLQQLGYAAEYLGLKGSWQKIEKLSHEL
jgi:hypothetical protein